MSTQLTDNTNTTFHSTSDELPLIISPYSKKLSVSLSFDPESDRTQQDFADECDINSIMARYQKTGVLDFTSRFEPQYGDATGHDFQAAMDTVVKANEMFANLPSNIRDRFLNSPSHFLDFINDENNAAEAAKMGLLSDSATSRILTPTPTPSAPPAPSNDPAAPAE